MDYLVDTNVLLRSLQRRDPHSGAARKALIQLAQAGDRLCASLQNAAEFWVVCTRPRDGTSNGLGLKVHQAERYFARFETLFAILPESAATYAHWKQLVVAHAVSGLRAHDTRLVALMLAHGIENILTFDVSDFKRYAGITVVHPDDIVSV